MSDKHDPSAATVAETALLKGLARLEKITKAQITGKLPGNSEPKGRWAYDQEPDEVTDAESDVSGDSGEEEQGGKKSDTDYKTRSAPVKKGMEPDDTEEGEQGEGGGDDGGEDDGDPFEGEGDDGGGDAPDDKDKKPDDDKETEKSFAARARASKHIRSGVEVSPFLRDLVTSLNKSQSGAERRIVRRVWRALDKALTRQLRFQKSVAEVLSGLSAVALEQGELLKAISTQPARGPKSQTLAVRPVQKSFDGGEGEQISLPDGSTAPQLERSVVMQRLLVGVQKGLIHPQEVIKFETTGIVHPGLYKSICGNPEFQK